MKEVNRYVNAMLITAIALTVMFVCGIPMIILGAGNKIYAVMGIGIAFTAIGFYGMPIGWVFYANNLAVRRVVIAVAEENLLTVQEISAQLTMGEPNVRACLDKAFNKGFLKGYKRRGDVITLNDNVPENWREKVAECPNCGAKFTYTSSGARCPYCNSPVKEEGESN